MSTSINHTLWYGNCILSLSHSQKAQRSLLQLPLCTQLTYFSNLKTSMKNQPLWGGEASFFEGLDATKATGCGFQIMVTDHCRDAGGERGSNLLWGAQFSCGGGGWVILRHCLPAPCGTENICCSAKLSSSQLNGLDFRDIRALPSSDTNVEQSTSCFLIQWLYPDESKGEGKDCNVKDFLR